MYVSVIIGLQTVFCSVQLLRGLRYRREVYVSVIIGLQTVLQCTAAQRLKVEKGSVCFCDYRTSDCSAVYSCSEA